MDYSNQYETPFADVPLSREAVAHTGGTSYQPLGYFREFESPFARTYETGPSMSNFSPFRDEYVQFRGQLDDHEFTNSLYEMAAELEESWKDRPVNETSMENLLSFARHHATRHFAPLIRASEGMIDRVAHQYSANSLDDHSETEVERFFSEMEFDHSELSPAQEQFFGGLFNKIKSVVKKGISLAKKGISLAGKILPIGIVLNKLKGLIKPLLEKVLRFAAGKLPKQFQPFAQILAKKILGIDIGGGEPVHAATETSENEVPAAGELESIQTELDHQIANLVFSPSETEANEQLAEYESSSETLDRTNSYETIGGEMPMAGAARQQFIQDLKTLPQGESPAVAIEHFLPGPLMALQPIFKIVSSIIGRPKIVNFLAGLLSKLIGAYVPENIAKPLSSSIVDAGLGVIGFETYEAGRPDLGYEAIAGTIQETMENLGSSLDEHGLNDQEILTAQLLEAFETAAANHFPASYIREDLRPAGNAGVWVLKPRTGGVHLYKKYSKAFPITIDPQAAQDITTFRSLPLANFLRDKLGLDPGKPIQARVHLYEAIDGTKLAQIARHEQVHGLGDTQPHGWIQLHPLSRQAAAQLLKEPGLGKDTDVKYTTHRSQIAIGQRFYYLEIAGARLRTTMVQHEAPGGQGGQGGYPAGQAGQTGRAGYGGQAGHQAGHRHHEGKGRHHQRPARSADIRGTVDFINSAIRLHYYFSEEDSKAIVEQLNRNDFVGAAAGVRHSVRHVLHRVLSRHISSKVKIIHEAVPELYLEYYQTEEVPSRHQHGPGGRGGGRLHPGKSILHGLIGKVIARISEASYQSIVELFKSRADEFKKAHAQLNDGVTVTLTWTNLAGMPAIGKVIGAIRQGQPVGDLSSLGLPEIKAPEIVIAAGKHFEDPENKA